jgi:hypothetical protein
MLDFSLLKKIQGYNFFYEIPSTEPLVVFMSNWSESIGRAYIDAWNLQINFNRTPMKYFQAREAELR